MDKHPVPEGRRRFFEAMIRFIDLVVYGVMFLGGFYALLASPATVVAELGGQSALIGLWAGLLMAGGLLGFVGRASRYWLVESPGPVAGFFGAAIYFVILGKTAFETATAAVAAGMVLVAAGFMVRRWAELQIFGSEPDHGWRSRYQAILARRTGDVVPRTYS